MFEPGATAIGRPPVLASADELLAGASNREPITGGAGKSGARLERVEIGGERYVVKYLDVDADWSMRAAGDLSGPTLALWRRGLLQQLPQCIDTAIVGVAHRPRYTPGGGQTVLLMRDVGAFLVPVTDDVIPLEQHLLFLDHMAALHAAFWESGEEIEIVPMMHRYLELSPWTAEAEAAIGSTDLVPKLVGQGWAKLADVAPAAAAVVTPLAWDPGPLVGALGTTPATLVHGNWKLDNLGVDASGRTILLDWEMPGRGPALSDLAWYLAINCRRLPQPKADSIIAYRAALERRGIDTDSWWERQLALCLLGALVQFGWEKAFGGYDDELRWWEARAVAAAALLR